jgi:dTDP-4-amino-4,6-dideoxygalactose transaminase
MFNSWPTYSTDEIDAAISCLHTGKVNYWTGEHGKLFEQEFAELCGVQHAVALANGTLALELALYSLGINTGDEVIVTPRTFIASASCIVLRGATPVFADVDSTTQNITPSSIQNVLSPRTKAIIAVHHAGWPCDMKPIMELAKNNGLFVIEDCAQALGAEYNGRPVGSFGDMAAFSFCQDKIVSTGGEGGMLVTSNKSLWEKAWSYKDHGKNFEKTRNPVNGHSFRWLHDSFGTNWRMTEMQAAIGRVQLTKLHNWRHSRTSNATILNKRFSEIPALRITVPTVGITHAYYKYYAFVRPELIRKEWSRDLIVEAINEKGIPCFTGSCPGIYMEGAFSRENPVSKESLSTALRLGETSLMFPVHPTLSSSDMEAIADGASEVLHEASLA